MQQQQSMQQLLDDIKRLGQNQINYLLSNLDNKQKNYILNIINSQNTNPAINRIT